MNLLPQPLRRVFHPFLALAGAPVQAPAPAPLLQAPPLAEELAHAEALAQQAAEALAARGCGWFDSSYELRQGLAVSECALADWAAWATATLDTVRLEPSSAQLQ